MYILGINAAFHDSSAALLKDGIPIAAAEEERFTRIKHAKRPVPFLSYQLPFHAIDYCLREAGITLREVDHVAYSLNPSLVLGDRDPRSIFLPLEPSAGPREPGRDPWEPLFLAGVVNAPRFMVGDVPHHLGHLREGIESPDDLPPFEYVEHHLAHAASAYYVSGLSESAILTIDGRGERTTTLHAVGAEGSITPLQSVEYPHSLGLLYEQATAHLGFLSSSDEYKVMALASSGSDRYVSTFRELVKVAGDGRYEIAEADFTEIFGPARRKGEPLEQRHYDFAAALQAVLEETSLALVSWLHARTGLDQLCLAGGVALNCVMNARLRDEGPFKRIFVQPAAGDAGTALGAAYVVDADRSGRSQPFTMSHACLGPGFSDGEIERALLRAKVPFERPPDIAAATAALLAEDRIIGWFQGRMEFGPRALGARSIVASPRDPNMKDRLNAIKDREEFRPVAPSVMEERLGAYFDPPTPDPFMLFTAKVREERAAEIPAVRHVDGTARLQSVSQQHAPLYHRLIEEFERLTGIGLIVNTSFNTLGRPIVCSPNDALECYFTSPLDALAIGPFLLTK